MTEQQTNRDFEDRFVRAVRSYAAEGVVDFDPRRISAHARTADTVPGRRWRGRATPILAFRVLRLALMVALLATAAAALAVVGSRLLAPHLLQPGLLALGSGDQILVVDPSSGMSHKPSRRSRRTTTTPSGRPTGRAWSSRSTTAEASCSSSTPTAATGTRCSAT